MTVAARGSVGQSDGMLQTASPHSSGVIDVRCGGTAARAAQRAAERGALFRLVPGIYLPSHLRNDPMTLMRAVSLWRPDATFINGTAAYLGYLTDNLPHPVEVAFVTGTTLPGAFHVVKRVIGPEWQRRREGIRYTHPALTAVDLAATDGGETIDLVLRKRRASLEDMYRAFAAFPGRVGNVTRERVLRRSRTNPWSQAERRLHQILDEGRVTGWVANFRVSLKEGVAFLDVAFPGERIALEVDGFGYHSSPEQMTRDYARQNELITSGWLVLRFTWAMLARPATVLQLIAQALKERRAGR